MTFKLKAVLATPNDDTDEDVIYNLDLPDKRALHNVEAGLIRAINHLSKLTEDELQSGKKPFAGTNPQLVTFTVDIEKAGADFGGYAFRWPGQTAEARAYVRGLLDGVMKDAGHANARQTKPKNWHRGRRG